MLVVALVSGGKDSCHALGLALRGGHEVACLANLAPPRAVMDAAERRGEGAGGSKGGSGGFPRDEGDGGTEETEDVDSHCFQTVGAVSVAALAAATGLTLVRRHLLSSRPSSYSPPSSTSAAAAHASSPSVDRNLYYDDAVAGDEVEDLAALLAACRRLFPGIRGVVSGAVASDYQRLRVEHAAARAGGLISVAPLWRRPQQQLLEEMERDGLDAVLVKVACVGLGRRHVGMRLREAVPELLALAGRFGVHPAGEGGEYETMTLDCAAFERARLVVAPSRSSSAASPALASTSSSLPPPPSSPSFSVVDAGAGTFVATGLRLEAVVKSGREGTPEGEIVWADAEAPPPRLPGPRSPPPPPAYAPFSSPSSADTSSPSSFVLSKCGSVRARVVCARSSAGGVQVSAVAEARRPQRPPRRREAGAPAGAPAEAAAWAAAGAGGAE
jgi:diphthine-ammonia ligase